MTPEDIKELNEPRPAVWCDRCQRVHAARPVGSFDRHISESAKKLADAIDQQALRQFLAQESGQ